MVGINCLSRRGLLIGVALSAAWVAGGCGGGANSPYPVHGTVYLDDQPATELAGATVTFNSPQLHKSASAEIQPNGTYRLETVPGKYQVSVSPPESAGPSERGSRPPAAKPIIFETPKNLEVTIEAKTNDIPIHLHRGGTPRR